MVNCRYKTTEKIELLKLIFLISLFLEKYNVTVIHCGRKTSVNNGIDLHVTHKHFSKYISQLFLYHVHV